MKTTKLVNGASFIELEKDEIEVYPDWNCTQVAHIRINDKEKERWTDAWVSVIVKNGRIRFDIDHERGYPSERKGTVHKSILASWLSDKTPVMN
jgi:hypothetical protein